MADFRNLTLALGNGVGHEGAKVNGLAVAPHLPDGGHVDIIPAAVVQRNGSKFPRQSVNTHLPIEFPLTVECFLVRLFILVNSLPEIIVRMSKNVPVLLIFFIDSRVFPVFEFFHFLSSKLEFGFKRTYKFIIQ